MSYVDIMDLSSDDEKIDVKAVKLVPDLVGVTMQQIKGHKAQLAQHQKSKTCIRSQDSEENRSSNGQSSTTVLEPEQSPVNETSLSSPSSICSAPLCRQFWKAGNYEDGLAPKKTSIQNGKNYLHIHPMFLHSNATSHKWAFGAIAELLDNAVDEIQSGATFVNVDKTTNPRNGSAALLIQDDGGGMDPDAMRRCMSFGFSDKKSKSAIGQYGNGFKTSSMRLGADVIVFSRHLNTRTMTQSIGLLSYTFLTRTSHDRIVVPMVQYTFNTASGSLEPLYLYGQDHFTSNLSVLLQWSPYSKEAELLKQFNDIGYHGTKVIVYNLWLSDDKDVELDFDRDPEDICLRGDTKLPKAINEQQIAHRFKFSLRVYLSILYLRLPESFKIILRGRDVEHHCIVNDLKFRELIMYRPQNGGSVEGEIVTTIGFLKEAPHVQFHGFNVYHKNRLILPFWQVVNFSDSRGRGVVGVLETNFIEPTHNKQDFERTSLFQKLEHRLKEMTWEYWDYHCGLIGYQVKKNPKVMVKNSFQSTTPLSHGTQPVILNKSYPVIGSTNAAPGLRMKRVELSHPPESLQVKRQAVVRPTATEKRKMWTMQTIDAYAANQLKDQETIHPPESLPVKRQAVVRPTVTEKRKIWTMQTVDAYAANQLKDQETVILMDENRKLHAQCLEHENMEKELNTKVIKLRSELGEVQSEYARLLAETGSLCIVKNENILRR